MKRAAIAVLCIAIVAFGLAGCAFQSPSTLRTSSDLTGSGFGVSVRWNWLSDYSSVTNQPTK